MTNLRFLIDKQNNKDDKHLISEIFQEKIKKELLVSEKTYISENKSGEIYKSFYMYPNKLKYNTKFLSYPIKQLIMSFSDGKTVNALLKVDKQFHEAFLNSGQFRSFQLEHLKWQAFDGVINFSRKQSELLKSRIKKLKKEIKKYEECSSNTVCLLRTGGIIFLAGFFVSYFTCAFQAIPCVFSCCGQCNYCGPCPAPDCATENMGGVFATQCCIPDGCCYPLSTACLAGYGLCSCAACTECVGLTYEGGRKCYAYLNPKKELEIREAELNHLPKKCEDIQNYLLSKMSFIQKNIKNPHQLDESKLIDLRP